MSEPVHYTHALWRVIPGREEEFVAAWNAVADAFVGLKSPPIWGTLLRSDAQPNVYYSFGPWHSEQDIAAMRADPGAKEAIGRAIALCEEATPANYRLVAHRVS